jgi:hypothetical protein
MRSVSSMVKMWSTTNSGRIRGEWHEKQGYACVIYFAIGERICARAPLIERPKIEF